MRVRYKILIVILLLWLGMSYEGSRDRDAPQVTGNRQNMTLDEQIRAYELGLIDGIIHDDYYPTSSYRDETSGGGHQGNLVARLGRNIGNALQTFVREALRGIVRFFDGIIS